MEKLIEWSEDKFSVGVESMDEHHKQLIELLNDLHNKMSSGEGSEVINDIVTRVIEYTEHHFKAEEKLLSKYHCQHDLEQQQIAHQALLTQIHEIKHRLDAGELFVTVEMLTFLKHWVQSHIMGLDRKYGACLCSKGAK